MIKITLANQEHLDELARLFNLYRIFYEQKDDIDRARDFIKNRLTNEESIIFISTDGSEKLNGFVQLYPSFCSVSTIPILILYDLYVDQNHRGEGVGRLLMNQARNFAKENDYKRLELSTAKDNFIGQSLYKSMGYEVDEDFFHFSLDIKE
jgi:ribosomal protein S18 acetylase RimI-like enzyme